MRLGDLSETLSVISLILSSEVLLRTDKAEQTLADLAEAMRILESNKRMKVLKLSSILLTAFKKGESWHIIMNTYNGKWIPLGTGED